MRIVAKRCPICDEVKPNISFSLSKEICRDCYYDIADEQKSKELGIPKEKVTLNRKSVEKHRKKDFGVSPELYDFAYVEQKGRCLICGDLPGERNLHADHCHETGEFRGLLCGKCNTGLGMFRDNEELLKRAVRYLRTRKYGNIPDLT